MVPQILIVTAQDIKSQTNIEATANENILSKLILNVQATQLRPLLGDTLYKTVTDAVYYNSIDSIAIPDPVALLLPLIKPFLINATVVDFIIMNNYKMTSKGTLKLNDNSGSSVASNEIELIKNYYDNYKGTYKNNLVKYLSGNNLEVFNNDRDTTSEASGWLLDTPQNDCGDLYEGLIYNNCGSPIFTGGSSDGGGFVTVEHDPIWEADKPGIQAQIDLKAPLESAQLTGIPTTTTAVPGTDTTQIASTAFVNMAIVDAIFHEQPEADPTVPAYAKTLINKNTILTDLETIDGTGSLLDADLLDGEEGSFYTDYNNLVNTPNAIINSTVLQENADFNIDGSGSLWNLQNGFTYDSSEIAYGFSQGCFIQTNIFDLVISWELYISGNSGAAQNPLFTIVNGSTAGPGVIFGSSEIINTSAIAIGSRFNIQAFYYNGFLCFWLPITASTSLHFKLIAKGSEAGTAGNQYQLHLTDAIKPTTGISNEITISPIQSWHGGNDGAASGLDADLLDGQQGSYYSDYNNLINTPVAAGIPNFQQVTDEGNFTTNSIEVFEVFYHGPFGTGRLSANDLVTSCYLEFPEFGGGARTIPISVNGNVADISGDISLTIPTGFSGAFADLTGIPTTIAGYGITDFNSLGDARWSLLAHTHTFASLTSIPTTVTGYGITDVYTKTLSDARYLQSFTETDPVFIASPSFGITSGNITSWNAKQNAITTGTTLQYFRGDLSLATFPTNVSTFTNDSGYLTGLTGAVLANGTVPLTASWNAGAFSITASTFNGNLNGNVTATSAAITAVTNTRTNLAVTSTDGILSQNTTASTAAIPVQYSPRYRQSGTAWNTTALASQIADWITEVRPTSANPITSKLVFASQVNGGGYTDIFTMQSNGVSTASIFNGNFSIVGNFTVQSGSIGSGITNRTLEFNNIGYTVASTTALHINRGTFSQASGNNIGVNIAPTYNQVTSTAANTDLVINRTETSIGSGAQLLIDAQVNGATMFNITNVGGVTSRSILPFGTSTYNLGGTFRGWNQVFTNNICSQASTLSLGFTVGNTIMMTLFGTSGNFMIQNAGTFTEIPSSRFTVNSTTQGFLPPRMTTTQKNAIATPATGLMVYDNVLNKLCVYTGAAWETITSV